MRILIIDDEPQICKTLQGLLIDEGYTVETAQTGQNGQDSLRTGSFDVLFLDVMLPDSDGVDILENILPTYPNLKIIMMSGHADLSTAIRATKLGAHTFFEKPLNPDKVLLELDHIKHQIQIHNRLISIDMDTLSHSIIGESVSMIELKRAIGKAAPSEGRVLILGENGTGKELVARSIHRESLRKEGPFISLNCAAIPETLVESELFGYEKGAFTGANQQKVGRFELANGGTLFLDEVGDMDLATQAKLLRVLEENEAMRVGGNKTYRFDVRIIAATNKNLMKGIETGSFREDLYYRLNVIPIYVPSLRERAGDVVLLANYFLQYFCEKAGKPVPDWDQEALQIIEKYVWPGNVRELRNVMERLYIMNDSNYISSQMIKNILPVHQNPNTPMAIQESVQGSLREIMNQYEKSILRKGFEETDGNVSELARRLQIDRANLHRKLKQHKIK